MSETKKKINSLRNLRVRVSDDYERCHGPNKIKHVDKWGFQFSENTNHHNMHYKLYFHHYDGVYGNSSVSSTYPDGMLPFLIRALNEKKHEIFTRAIELITEEEKACVTDLKNEIEEMQKIYNELEEYDNG